MDIDLLSKIVKEIILDNDVVTLPGIGAFVTEIVPSSFSDKGYTINPPYRRLYFSQKEGSDSLLVDFYAKSNGIAVEDSRRIIVDFLMEMRQVLEDKKTIVFPGLGRLRATKENNFFFISDEDLDIYPNGFGLEPVSLKTHQETKEEVSAAMAGLKSIIDAPVVQPKPAEPETIVEPAEPEPASEPAEPEPVAENVIAPAVEPAEPEPASEPAEPEQAVEPAQPEPEPVAEPVGPEPAAEPEVVEPAQSEPATEPVQPEPEPVVENVVEPAEPEPAAEPAEPEPAAEPKEKAAKEPKQRKKTPGWKILMIIAIVLMGIAILALASFIILSYVDPTFIDTLLYTPEELEILNY